MSGTIVRSAAFVLLAGCASLEQETAQVRDAWQDAPYDEVVRRWGAPARSATLQDGAQVHTWVSAGETRYGGSGTSMGVGVFGGSGGGGVGVGIGFPIGSSRVEATGCERTFTFRNGAVVQQSWTGDPGYCNSFRRR